MLKEFGRFLVIMYLILAGLSQTVRAEDKKASTDCDPYTKYSCLDDYLGRDFFSRLGNYYYLEGGHAGPPADPNAPPSSRPGWPATPQSTPPMPFTEWPYGGTETMGVNRPASIDSPLMVALGNTSLGKWMADNHLQFYGWINAGFNISSNSQRNGGNSPIAYTYYPNTTQLDQIVTYFERTPDTVQTDHVDWGFRLSGIYGQNYRYTTSYGIASYQLLTDNAINGYDFPMEYLELYIPKVGQGLLLRLGRFISIPDIEAQLAPNNYMYTHSMTYSWDNYTNEGLAATLAVNKNLLLQVSISCGTEATCWNMWKQENNPNPNPLFPNSTFPVDPGDKPSIAVCARMTWNDGHDNFYPCMDSWNSGDWGYNNLQWAGFTYYHKFNDQWHISYELYDLHQNNVININNPAMASIYATGGTPFSPPYITFNAPNGAQCDDPNVMTCTAEAIGTVAYLNYQFSPLDNISFRPEYYDDMQGQRTGVKTAYVNFGIGWQHWTSPQLEFRPEIDFDHSINTEAFNGSPTGHAPNRNYTLMFAMDMIAHF